MPITVAKLSEIGRQLTSGRYSEYVGAAASGVLDGILIETEHGGLWLVKNIVGALMPFVLGSKYGVVEGFAKHSLGNAAMILVLSIGKRVSQGGGS